MSTVVRIVRRSVVLAALAVLVLAAVGAVVLAAIPISIPGDGPAPATHEGRLLLVKRTNSDFDRYTSAASARTRAWMNQRLWRAVVFSPYFDDKTSWYRRGWAYYNLYGIPVGSGLARRHPDWILRDAHGAKLYIPYACGGGHCAQYAGDTANPAFRRHWIAVARGALSRGYTGLWIDDVNLEFRVGDGAGDERAPYRHGRRVSPTAWRNAIASWTAAIRRALPQTEIVHNAIWFAGGSRRQADPAVRREIQSADMVNLERGVNDGGLTGGDGVWSVNALLRYVDTVHALGRAVIFEGVDPSPAGREYNLAAALLVSDGHDALSADDATPDDLWAPYGYDLGGAAGGREAIDGGVLRRRFSGGMALVNPPGAPARTIDLGGRYLDTSGHLVTSVRLGGARGAVLRALP